MAHAIHRVERFEIVAPYTLALRFNDGTEQTISISCQCWKANCSDRFVISPSSTA